MIPLVTVRLLRDASRQGSSGFRPHSAIRVSPAIRFDCGGGIPTAWRIIRASSTLANGDLPWNAGGQHVRDQPVQILYRIGELPDTLSECDDEVMIW